jgi:hypothetical protein
MPRRGSVSRAPVASPGWRTVAGKPLHWCIVYRWGRLSSIFVGFFIAFFLREFGVDRVFAIIAGAMEIVAIALARYWAWRSTRSLYE